GGGGGGDADHGGATRRPPRLPADPFAHARLQQAGAPMTTRPSDVRTQCSAKVPSGRTYYACMNRAKVERGGKWYCAIHDPERVKTKQAKWEADFQKRWDQQRADENAAEERARRLGMGRPPLRRKGKGPRRLQGRRGPAGRGGGRVDRPPAPVRRGDAVVTRIEQLVDEFSQRSEIAPATRNIYRWILTGRLVPFCQREG